MQQLSTEFGLDYSGGRVHKALEQALSEMRYRNFEIDRLLNSDYVKEYIKCPECGGVRGHINYCRNDVDFQEE